MYKTAVRSLSLQSHQGSKAQRQVQGHFSLPAIWQVVHTRKAGKSPNNQWFISSYS